MEEFAGDNIGTESRYQTGLNSICSTLSEDILQEASPLWKETRGPDEVMRLWDFKSLYS